MRPVALFILLLFLTNPIDLKAQYAAFPTSGAISFEKRVNVFAILQKKTEISYDAASALVLETYKKDYPQFIVLKSELRFDKGKSIFLPDNSPPSPLSAHFGEDPLMTQINTIYTDTRDGLYTVQKTVLGKTYLVQDSLPNIKWRITDETREIAGHPCRRANGLMQDSIYVVAFYTNDIHLPVGPESFHGLPGTILGVALPHYHVSWFATDVVLNGSGQRSIKSPDKGDRVNSDELRTILNQVLQTDRSWRYQTIDHYFF